ncbi:MAG: PQQ-dependent sugar dehydrogenase [Thermomicrobiales bacterium]
MFRSIAIGVCLITLSVPTLVSGAAPRLQEATPVAVPGTEPPVHLEGDLPDDPTIALIQVASGLSAPTNVAFPPDASGRIFVVEQEGTIRIVKPDGTLEPEPFLKIPEAAGNRRGEQGLLGLAFHPDYAQNGRFYVDYNDLSGNGAITVSEFQVSKDNPNIADPGTERPLLVIPKPFPTHNGGTLKFGPDGYLYIATGDGGWQGDPWDSAQSRFSLLGKILRIDVDGATPGSPYGIPADNPFAGEGRFDNPYPGRPQQTPEAGKSKDKGEKDRARDKGEKKADPSAVSPENRKKVAPVRKEIWAYGFRNPWQFSFDPATGDVYIGDVGADSWEEIDVQPAGMAGGQNYGWDYLEASHCFPKEITECPRQQIGLLPVAEYEHGADGCAVIGVGVYRGEEYPSLDGIFFAGDLCSGKVRGLQRDANGDWQFQTLLDTALLITGSGQDKDGNLYVTSSSTREGTDVAGREGSLWKVVSADKVPAGATTAPLGQGTDSEDFGDAAADAPPAEDTNAAATPAAVSATATIVMSEMLFTPSRITIPANSDVIVTLDNQGAADHNFSIGGTDISIDVAAGDTADVTLNLPPGRYRFSCNVPGHKEDGMDGVLIAE